jgi:aerobic carbon-monoxide dehydrogenase small subunit
MDIELLVNGRRVHASVSPRTHLADFLREQLLLTGTHIGCEHGICGACTVEINGEIARSCITFAVACDGANVRTIEGFDDDPLMDRLRKTFAEEHALQCGYCTPGMLVAARDLVRRKAGLSRAEIRAEMTGNLCRCTGYMGLVNAIERVMGEQPSAACHVPASGKVWLGPAPGPVAASATPRPATMPTQSPARPTHASAREQRLDPIRVTVGAVTQIDGKTQLAQSFVLNQPRETVWELMSSPEAIARCMPGLTLDDSPDKGSVSGRLDVKLGPIVASFRGTGTVRSFASEYRQVIDGGGADGWSGSRVSGGVEYRLHAVTGASGQVATRVDVTVSYALTGPLAQIGRAGIVRDLARRMGEAFAQILASQLAHPGERRVVGQLRGVSLLLGVLVDRFREMAKRLVGANR